MFETRSLRHGVCLLAGSLLLAWLPSGAAGPGRAGSIAGAWLGGSAWAQVPGAAAPRPGFELEKFFERMFGDESGEQRRALEQVQISWRDEEQFGRQAVDRYRAMLREQKIRVVSRGRDAEYVQRLVATLRPQMRNAGRYRSVTVLLAESSDVDARSFAGGTLIIFRGLLEFAPSEAAVVGILGHELSHIDHGHQLRYLKSMKLAERTFSPGQSPTDLGQMLNSTMLWTKMFARPFRPEEEMEADLDGATWAYRAGYDPRELAQLFWQMEERAGEKPLPFLSFFRSHPYNRERYKAVWQRYEALQDTEPRDDLYVGRRNLSERVPRSQREFDERK